MPYFEDFPIINYDVIGNKNLKTIRDITTRIRFKGAITGNHALFKKYNVNDGETPESIAFREYGDSQLHWVVLLFNDILDPRYDWPLSQRDLNAFVKGKYTDPDGEHHREIAQSSGIDTIMIRVESDTPGSTIITNFEYEDFVNAKKAQIRLLKTDHVSQVINEFSRELLGAATSEALS